FAPLILGGATLLIWFALTCLNGRTRTLALAGVACWAGTIAAEFVESIQWRNGWTRGLQVPIEEGLEVIGATFFFIAFVESLRQVLGIATPAAHPAPTATPTPRAAAAPA